MIRTVTKAMVIHFIDGKCHIIKRKSHKTALSGYYACVSCDVLLMASGADTHTHTDVRTKTISRNQALRLHAPGLIKKDHNKILKPTSKSLILSCIRAASY